MLGKHTRCCGLRHLYYLPLGVGANVSSMRQDAASNGQDNVLDDVRDIDQHRTGPIQDATRQQSSTRATVHEAANALSVSVDAIRKRIQRGTIPHERHEDGRVYVLLDKASTMQDASSTAQEHDQQESSVRYGTEELVESLQDQITFLRRELERKDAILLRMAERIPELEAPSEPRGDDETAFEHRTGGDISSGSQEPAQRGSWWRRFFGFD